MALCTPAMKRPAAAALGMPARATTTSVQGQNTPPNKKMIRRPTIMTAPAESVSCVFVITAASLGNPYR
jgi:hypothetical protein